MTVLNYGDSVLNRSLVHCHRNSGIAADALPQQEVAIRGRNEPMVVRSVTDAKMLSTLIPGVKAAAA